MKIGVFVNWTWHIAKNSLETPSLLIISVWAPQYKAKMGVKMVIFQKCIFSLKTTNNRQF